jgi:hypothetical protein
MKPTDRTKANYIKLHPKSYLAAELIANDWPDDTIIEIVGGLEAPTNKCSNLYKALSRARLKEYAVGGRRQSKSEGFWFAVA